MIQHQLALDDSIPHLQEYQVRESARARSVSLRVLPLGGLEVVIPRRFNRQQIPAILRENSAWIERALARQEERIPASAREWPPTSLPLRALQRELAVDLVPDATASCGCVTLQGDLMQFRGPDLGRESVAELAENALKQVAKRCFPAMVEQAAAEHGFTYARVRIRAQKTLWGSCSSKGTISLNYKLLFLSPELCRYVLLHELAHTRHLDHSPRFWKVLEAVQPGARQLDRQLSAASAQVPLWLERG